MARVAAVVVVAAVVEIAVVATGVAVAAAAAVLVVVVAVAVAVAAHKAQAPTAVQADWAANTEVVVAAEVPAQPLPVLAVPVAMVSLLS